MPAAPNRSRRRHKLRSQGSAAGGTGFRALSSTYPGRPAMPHVRQEPTVSLCGTRLSEFERIACQSASPAGPEALACHPSSLRSERVPRVGSASRRIFPREAHTRIATPWHRGTPRPSLCSGRSCCSRTRSKGNATPCRATPRAVRRRRTALAFASGAGSGRRADCIWGRRLPVANCEAAPCRAFAQDSLFASWSVYMRAREL